MRSAQPRISHFMSISYLFSPLSKHRVSSATSHRHLPEQEPRIREPSNPSTPIQALLRKGSQSTIGSVAIYPILPFHSIFQPTFFANPQPTFSQPMIYFLLLDQINSLARNGHQMVLCRKIGGIRNRYRDRIPR